MALIDDELERDARLLIESAKGAEPTKAEGYWAIGPAQDQASQGSAKSLVTRVATLRIRKDDDVASLTVAQVGD
jgi:hypothetical protein